MLTYLVRIISRSEVHDASLYQYKPIDALFNVGYQPARNRAATRLKGFQPG